MQTAQLAICTTCGSLKDLYSKVECSIFQLIRNKWNNQTYSLSLYFDEERYRTLLRLRRILYKRLFNQEYPNDCISTGDIISLATKLVYKSDGCPICPCDNSDVIETTTTVIR